MIQTNKYIHKNTSSRALPPVWLTEWKQGSQQREPSDFDVRKGTLMEFKSIDIQRVKGKLNKGKIKGEKERETLSSFRLFSFFFFFQLSCSRKWLAKRCAYSFHSYSFFCSTTACISYSYYTQCKFLFSVFC